MWGVNYTYTVTSSSATTDNGKTATPRYTISFDGGVLMKTSTGGSTWTAASTTISDATVYYLATGSKTFTFKTTNAITSFTIYGTAGTGSNRTISSITTSTTTSDYSSATYTAEDGITSSTAIGSTTVTSSIAANTYVCVTFSGNIYLTQLVLTAEDPGRTYDGTEKMFFLRDSWSWWNDGGAKFYAYFWNSSTSASAWSAEATSITTTDDSKTVYGYTVPEGTWDKVIFVRINPSATENNWNNKWNQSANLDITDGKLYTVPSNSWDYWTA
jgi:hypothetical protein